MSEAPWTFGDVVVRREWLHGQLWVGFATYVVEDSDDLMAVYLAEGSELAFPDWPFDQWVHPWFEAGHRAWHGHGKLMLHRPGDAYSVDLFWTGSHRTFAGWYVNLQEPFSRYGHGFDTLDHELDYWMTPDGSWTVKDDELFEQRIAERRYSTEQAASIRATGAQVAEMLSSRSHWWNESWAEWRPPPHWTSLDLPLGWEAAPSVFSRVQRRSQT